MKKLFVLAIAFLMAGMVNATVCDLDLGTNCDYMTGWGAYQTNGYYGNDDLSNPGSPEWGLVVAKDECTDPMAYWATVGIDGKAVKIDATGNVPWAQCSTYGQVAINWIELTDTKVVVRHLDGIGDDSLSVYVDGRFICSYDDKDPESDAETWITTECCLEQVSTPEFITPSIALVILLTSPGFAYLLAKKN